MGDRGCAKPREAELQADGQYARAGGGHTGSEGGRLGRLGLGWLNVSELAEMEEQAGDEPRDHSGNRHRAVRMGWSPGNDEKVGRGTAWGEVEVKLDRVWC